MTRTIFQSFEIELYPCKGHQFVLHCLYQINFPALSVRRLFVIGVPEFLTSCSSTYTSSVPKSSVPSQSDNVPGKWLSQAPLPRPSPTAMATNSAGKNSISLPASQSTEGNPMQQRNNFQNVLDFKSNLSLDEKKFLIFQHIFTWTIHYHLLAKFIYLFYLVTAMLVVFLKLRAFVFLILLDCTALYAFFTKYQVWNEKDFMRKFECYVVLNYLSNKIIKNSVDYIKAGSAYCMKKLKFNYHVYEEQKRSLNSPKEKIFHILRLVFHSLVPNSENIYGHGGQIKSWPFNHFNYDFLWAYYLKKELNKLPQDSFLWKKWLSNCGQVSLNNLETQQRIIPTDKLNGIPLIFKSVVVPFSQGRFKDFISAPPKNKPIARQAEHLLRLYGLHKSSETHGFLPS